MKVNLRKIGAVVAGATILASSVAFAGLVFQNTPLVNQNGEPLVKVVVGQSAAASDGVAAANIAAKISSEAFKSSVLTASVSGEPTCAAGGAGAGECTVTDEKVKLEFTVPGASAAGTYAISNLIGDVFDRTLEDRGLGATSDYNFTTAETSSEANPFSNGASTTLGGQTTANLYKIDGSKYTPFADYTVEDKDAGKTYKEEQMLWIRADTKWQTSSTQVEGKLKNIIYQLKFYDSATGNFGLPVCSQSDSNNSWATCSSTDSNRFSTHKVKVKFGGSDWVVTKLENPSIRAENLTVLHIGGEVDLAKESLSGIVNVGDVLKAQSGYSVRLDDIKAGTTAAEQSAIVSILDSNGNVLKQTTVAPGSTSSITIGSDKIMVRVYKTAPGYTYGAKWADMAIIQNELSLKDSLYPEVNGDNSLNKDANWRVRLGWKKKETAASAVDPYNYSDHLRTILIYKDTSSNYLSEGEYVDIMADPASLRLTYKGLDLDPSSSSDYDTLSIQVRRSEDFSFRTQGNSTTVTLEATTNIFDSWLDISSTVDDAFASSSGSGARLAVLFGNGTATYYTHGDTYRSGIFSPFNSTVNSTAEIGFTPGNSAAYGDPNALNSGVILLKLQGSAGEWVRVGDATNGTKDVRYKVAGTRETVNESGALRMGGCNAGYYSQIAHEADLPYFDKVGLAGANFSSGVASGVATNNSVTYCVGVSEDAGDNLAERRPDFFAFAYNVSKKDLNVDQGSYAKDKVLAGGVYVVSNIATAYETYDTTVQAYKVGFVTERGSIFDSIDSENAVVKVAKKPARAQFLLSGVDSDVTSSTATQVWTGAKGDETTIDGTGGVKVKVADITYTPGSCSVGGGATPSCTVDESGMSAVILPAGTPTVNAVLPYGYTNYAPLVVLDSELTSDTVVTVGGPVVNTKTKELMTGAAVVLDAVNPTLVWEAVPGKSIVVAGWSATDTLAATQNFISQLQSQ
ncbi:MAG: S-layer protein [Candidatus Micrarchaeota archaeon]